MRAYLKSQYKIKQFVIQRTKLVFFLNQRFTTASLSLFSANASPNITVDVMFNVTVGEANSLTLTTDDADGDTVNVALESVLPYGATFEKNVYTWTPTSLDVVNISYVFCMTLTKQ